MPCNSYGYCVIIYIVCYRGLWLTALQESHPECNLRVPAIVGALEKMELTAKVISLCLA